MSRPRLGFLGVGWIGRNRLAAVLESETAEVAAVADTDDESLRETRRLVPGVACCASIDELLGHDLDGLVVATPSALHASQCLRAFEHELAVFCQKPLARNARETRAVVEAARRADRLLGVDYSYRCTRALEAIRATVSSGELGQVFAADLVFHNAYGPDRPWFYDRELSGGGCLMDLGVHLVDAMLWCLDQPEVEVVDARLLSCGQPLQSGAVEDFAAATLELEGGVTVRLACSWRLHAGQDCVLETSFYGTRGGASMRNVGGSFYDFTAHRFRGTSRDALVIPPDVWGGRAAVAWARQLASSRAFDPRAAQFVRVAEVLDGIYAA